MRPDILTSEQKQILREDLQRIRPVYNLKIVVLYAMAVGTGWLILEAPHWVLRLPLYLFMACIFAGLGVILHDGAHGLLFRSRFWNRVVASIIATTLGIGFTQFRYAHIFHHRDAMNASDRDRLFYLKSIPYTIAFGGQALYRSTVAGLRTAGRRQVLSYVAEMACVALFWGSVVAFLYKQGWLMPFVHVFLIPFAIFPPLLIARLLLEHYDCDPDDEFKLTRSFESNAFVRFLWGNVNFHTIHHFWPKIPWYNLAKAHALIRSQLIEHGAHISPGYAVVLWQALRKHGLQRPAYWAFPRREDVVWKKRRPTLRDRGRARLSSGSATAPAVHEVAPSPAAE